MSEKHGKKNSPQKHDRGNESPEKGDMSDSSSFSTVSAASSFNPENPSHHRSSSEFISFWNKQTSDNFRVSWVDDGQSRFIAYIQKGPTFVRVYKSKPYDLQSTEEEAKVMKEADFDLAKICRDNDITIKSDSNLYRLFVYVGIIKLIRQVTSHNK